MRRALSLFAVRRAMRTPPLSSSLRSCASLSKGSATFVDINVLEDEHAAAVAATTAVVEHELLTSQSAADASTALMTTPKSCAIAAQPYQTLAGPALSMTFAYDELLHPFQKRQFTDAAVPSLYAHSLLDHLAEFVTTVRTQSRKGANDVRAPPMKNFWSRVGTLNTVYCTLHRTRDPGAGRSESIKRLCVSTEHPAAGSIELTASTHRGGSLLDVHSSLHDAHHQPIATILWTGTASAPSGLTRLESAEGEERAVAAMQRTPMFHRDGSVRPAFQEQVAEEGAQVEELLQHERGQTGDASTGAAQPAPRIQGARCVRLHDGGVAALVSFCDDSNDVAQPLSTSAQVVAVPPWIILDVVELFCRCAVTSLGGVAPAGVAHDAKWVLAAYHHTQDGDIDACGECIEVVAAPPKVFPSYTLPPWKHRTGLPMLRGEPCIVWHAELRQSGRLVSSGVYYFTTGLPLSSMR